MNTFRDELVDEVHVVLQRVLGLLGVRDIAAVADDGLDDTTRLLRGIDTETQVLDVVERIEDTEDVETVLHSLLGEIVDGVVTTNQSAIPLISRIDTTHG